MPTEECRHTCSNKAACKHQCCKRHLSPDDAAPAAPSPATPGSPAVTKAVTKTAVVKPDTATTPKARARSPKPPSRPTTVLAEADDAVDEGLPTQQRHRTRAVPLVDVLLDILKRGRGKEIETLPIPAEKPLPATYIYHVQNVKGSSRHRRKAYAGGWIRLYESLVPELGVPGCAVHGCGGNGDVGGHVWIKGLPQDKVYFIVPLCHSHNHRQDMEEGCGRWQQLKSGVRPLPIHKHEDL